MRYLAVIPTYNERENIEKLLAKIDSLFLLDLDVLVVDDNSPDGTAAIVKKCQALYKRVFILERPGKMGLGTAYREGFLWGLKRGYGVFIELDADFSHNPDYLPLLLEKIKDYDFIIGSRYVAGGGVENWSWARRKISVLGSWYARFVLGAKIKDFTGGFNVWRATVLEKIGLDTLGANGYFFQIELKYRAWQAGFRYLEIPITFKNREQGKSKINNRIIREALWRIPYLRLQSGPAAYREFLKFSVVGLSGLIVDFGLLILLAEVFQFNVLFANSLSFSAAVVNNFIWNRLWTFPDRAARKYQQLGKFFLVSLVGLGLNIVLMKILIDGGIWYLSAKLIITVIVVLWNFFANKYWTFRATQSFGVKEN